MKNKIRFVLFHLRKPSLVHPLRPMLLAALLLIGQSADVLHATAGWTPPQGSVPPPTVVTIYPTEVEPPATVGTTQGSNPMAHLVVGPDGALYGVMARGGTISPHPDGNGTLFKLQPNGSFTQLHVFNWSDGSYLGSDLASPSLNVPPLVVGTDKALYGCTYQGGASGVGTIFKLGTDGTFTKLHDFAGDGVDGYFPDTGLVLGRDGAMYGTTSYGGTFGNGAIFRMETNGTYTVLHSFSYEDGGLFNINYNGPVYPDSALVFGPDGALYGSTTSGGVGGGGTLFKLQLDGTFTKLRDFTDASSKSALVVGSDGALYGSTSDELFRVTTDGDFSYLYGTAVGETVSPAMVLGPDGALYGSTIFPTGPALYKLETNGVVTILHPFVWYSVADAPLVVGPGGAMYGATAEGFFKVQTDGTFTALCDSSGGGGYGAPSALVLGPDEALYGAGYTLSKLVLPSTRPLVEGLSPSQAIAGSGDLSVMINGVGFLSGARVFFDSVEVAVTYLGTTGLGAIVPANSLPSPIDFAAVQVTVLNPGGGVSKPTAFTVIGTGVSGTVGQVDSSVAGLGETASVQTPPTTPDSAGVTASLENSTGTAPATVTAATYTENPTPVPAFDAGGGFVDLQVTGADPADRMEAAFYYPQIVTGTAEAALQLLYFDGSAWVVVSDSGGTIPAKNTTDNLDGTVSGGRFSVTFNNTSTPKITELDGTVFTATVIEAPQITTQPHAIVVLAGASAVFSVEATGGQPLSYQWLRGGLEINGQTADTLTLANVSVLDIADYSVRISNVAGQVVSQPAALSVNKRTPVVTWPAPSGIVYGTPLGAAQFNATADVPGAFAYTPGSGTVLSAGNSQVVSATFTPTDLNRYVAVATSATINVTKAPLTIQADNLAKIYGATLPALTVSYTGLVSGDTAASLSAQPVLGTSATPASPVGGYPITISGGAAANYTITLVPGTLTVTKAPLTITADNKSKAYGAVLPALTLTYNGFVNGETAAKIATQPALSTTAVKASPVGAYPITVSGATAANYSITMVPGTLTVTPVALTITAQSKTKIYGNAVPALTVTYSGFVNGDNAASLDTPVTLSTAAITNSPVGTYPIVVNGASDANYVISFVNASMTVTPRNLTITAQNKTKVYGAALPALTASYSGLAPGETFADLDTPPLLATVATPASNVGTYPITVSGAADPNYTITLVNGTLTVNPAALTVRAANKSKTYGASVPALTYTITGLVNGDTEASLDTPVAITTTGGQSSAVTTYPIMVSGASDANYNVTFANGTLTVSKATLTIKAQNATKAYGAALPILPVTYTGFVLGENESVLTAAAVIATTVTPSSNAGNYPITVNGATAANYAITFQNGTLTVSKVPLTITADNKTKTKGTANPVFTASYAGFVNGDTVSSLDTPVAFSTTATTTSPVGSYPITPKTAKDVNYTVTFVNGTLAVTP